MLRQSFLRASFLAGVFLLCSSAFASAPAPGYHLDVAAFQQGADFGLVTGMNNSLQAVYDRVGETAYFWNGHQETQLPPGAALSQSVALDLNDTGIVVGLRIYLGQFRMGVRWDNGIPTQLVTLGGQESTAGAINSQGLIAGWASDAIGQKHLVTWNGGAIHDLGLPPASLTCCYEIAAINNSQQIVGFDEGAQLNGWIFDKDHFVALPDLAGGIFSTPFDINESGLVVGMSSPHQTNTRPVTWTNGIVSPLPLPIGAVGGEARAVNDQNEIVGYTAFVDANMQYSTHALLWKDGGVFKLEDLVDNLGDWRLWQGEQINDHGQIDVFAYSDRLGFRRVILSPVPEPAAFTLSASGLFFLILFGCRRPT